MVHNVENYKKIIAIKERSAGNESVGSMWLETKSFDINIPVIEIMKWGQNADGKIILSIDQDSSKISEQCNY